MRDPRYNGINDSIRDENYRDAVRQERKEMYDGTLYYCPFCGTSFPSHAALKAHGMNFCEERNSHAQ